MVPLWSRAQPRGVPGARARKKNARGAVPHPKPPWRLLYGIFIIGTGAVGSVEFFIPASGTRILLEAVVVLLMYGLAALWLYVHRKQLSFEDPEPAEAGAGPTSNGRGAAQPPECTEGPAGPERDAGLRSGARFLPRGRRSP